MTSQNGRIHIFTTTYIHIDFQGFEEVLKTNENPSGVWHGHLPIFMDSRGANRLFNLPASGYHDNALDLNSFYYSSCV